MNYSQFLVITLIILSIISLFETGSYIIKSNPPAGFFLILLRIAILIAGLALFTQHF